MQRVPSRSTQPEFRPRRTAISAELAVRGQKFRSQIPVLDRGFGRKPGAPTGVGSRSGGAETTVVRIGLSTRPSRNPGEPGAAKPGRPERAFGSRVRCAGPKLRRRTTIVTPTTLCARPS